METTRTSPRTAIAVLAPPIVIGIVGLTHPAHLTQDASAWWRDLHIVLLPLFPLLAVGPWLVARSIEPIYGRITLVLAYVYACFYSALDVLAGIAAGALKSDREGGLGTYGFMENHVYPPWGVLSMLAIAAGWAWMLTAAGRAPGAPAPSRS